MTHNEYKLASRAVNNCHIRTGRYMAIKDYAREYSNNLSAKDIEHMRKIYGAKI